MSFGRHHDIQPQTLSYYVASAVVLLGTSTSIAANRSAPAARSGGLAELNMQILLDRANFSSGEIDGKGGKNSREALAAFQAARGLGPGARSRKALLKMLGPGTVKPIVSYTITATDAAGPFNKTIPEDATEQSKLPGLYYTSGAGKNGGQIPWAQALLKRLNPHAPVHGWRYILRVPNHWRCEPRLGRLRSLSRRRNRS